MLLFSHRRRAGQSTLPGGAQPPTTFQQTPPKRNFTQRRHFCPRGCWWGTPGASSCRSSPGLSSALGSVRFGVGLDALKGLSQPKCLRDSTIVSRPNQRRLARTTACPAPGFHRPEHWADQPSAKPPVPLRTTLVFLQVRGAPGGACQEPRGEVQPRAASPPRSLPTPRQPAPARSPAPLGAAGSPRHRQDASVFQPLSAALWFEPVHREAPPLLQRLLGVKPAAFRGRRYSVLSQRPS